MEPRPIPPILVKKSLSENILRFFVFYFKKTFYLCTRNWETTQFFPSKMVITIILGEMVEWSITAVLKTAVLRGTGGSNPSLSANRLQKDFTKVVILVFKI